jgi:hypothetical protein
LYLPISLFNATDNSSTVMFYKSFNIPLVYNLPISLFKATYNSSTVRFYKSLIKNGQSRETGIIGYTRGRQTKQKTQHNMC